MIMLSTVVLCLLLGAAFVMLLRVVTVTHTRGVNGGDITTTETKTVTGDGLAYANPLIPLAYSAVLGTKTSATAGILTGLPLSFNIIVGQRIDIQWTVGGVRAYCYGAIVSAVTASTLTFSGASGTALPAAASAVTVCAAQQSTFSLIGSNLQSLVATCQTGNVIFTFSTNSADLYSVKVLNGSPLIWKSGDTATNPLLGMTPTKVWISSDSTTTRVADAKCHGVTNMVGTGSS